MSFLLSVLFFCGVCDLGTLFADKSTWEQSSVDFAVENSKYGFTFASQKRDIVNCLARGTCKWHGLDVWESRIYYSEQGVDRVEMSLYNRGDDRSGQDLGAEELTELLNSIADKVSRGATVKGSEKIKLPSGGYSFSKKFEKTDPSVEITWGVNSVKKKEMAAQFVRVTMYKKRQSHIKRRTKKPVSGVMAKSKVKQNVTRNNIGDVWIENVPMVDQGQKGYCAAAVAERVLRYYGNNVDEHEIAQMAGTHAKGGTSVSNMKETVREMGIKYRLGYQDVVSFSGSFKDIKNEIEMYNKAAKALDEKELSFDSFVSGNVINVGDIRKTMKPKVLKRMRTKDFRYKKFLTSVKNQIDAGIPVIWGVTLGIFPEPGIPQLFGGHMRLIIGYNEKKKEILYSDTWGAGHELKRMPQEWAFAITHDAFFLRPL